MNKQYLFCFHKVLITLVVLMLAACNSVDDIPLKKLSSNAVIVAFGDSLTYGTGVISETESYPAVLSELTQRKVINAGVPGEVSREGLQRLDSVLEQYNPALVILCHGGNDLIKKLSKQELATNLTTMIRTIRASGAEVMMLSVPGPGFLVHPDPTYIEVAESEQVLLDDNTIAQLESDIDMKSDPIHFNENGYRHLAKQIHIKLKQVGAL